HHGPALRPAAAQRGEELPSQRPLRSDHPEVMQQAVGPASRAGPATSVPLGSRHLPQQPRHRMAAKLLPLDHIDPGEAWQPWQPSAADPWGRKWAAHLYRRAAFGPSREDLLEAERLGPQGTLDLLLRGRPDAEEILETLTDIGRVAVARDDGGRQLRAWWLY